MRRVTVDFSDEAFETLDTISAALNTSKAEALRKSLSLMRYVLEEKKRGGKLVIENEKENRREVIVQL